MQDSRYKFAMNKNLPKQYLRIIKSLQAHRDNEYYSKDNVYVVKKLPFQSEAATTFIQRLDEVMKKADQADGKQFQKRWRVQMKNPAPTLFPKAPKGLPIEFYNVDWYNDELPGERSTRANLDTVAFLPNPAESLHFKNPNERMNDKNFTQKHWDRATKNYNFDFLAKDESEDEEEDDDNGDSDYGESIDLTFSNDESEDEEEDEYEEEAGSKGDYQRSMADSSYGEYDQEDVGMDHDGGSSEYVGGMTQNKWSELQ